MVQDDETRHSIFAQMLDKDNAELAEDIQVMMSEIRRIQEERAAQHQRYIDKITLKETTIKCKQNYHILTFWQS
jgi:ribosomal protein L1